MKDTISDGWGESKERGSFKRTLRERSSDENTTTLFQSAASRSKRVHNGTDITSRFYKKKHQQNPPPFPPAFPHRPLCNMICMRLPFLTWSCPQALRRAATK
jgi:hypothetical protein